MAKSFTDLVVQVVSMQYFFLFCYYAIVITNELKWKWFNDELVAI